MREATLGAGELFLNTISFSGLFKNAGSAEMGDACGAEEGRAEEGWWDRSTESQFYPSKLHTIKPRTEISANLGGFWQHRELAVLLILAQPGAGALGQ